MKHIPKHSAKTEYASKDIDVSWKIFWFRTITVLLYFSCVSLLFLLFHEKLQGFS